MKKTLLAVSFLISLSCSGQVLEKVWKTSETGNGLPEINARVERLVSRVNDHRYNNEVKKLHSLFLKTHRQFLGSYVQYSGIEELAEGRFDCLTATSLFADVLTKAGYTYKMIETNYHIFIVVNTSNGEVVLETTDRFGGFVTNKKKMNAMLSQYRKNTLASATPSHHQYSFSLYQSVDVDKLAGLLYFNQAVKAFNTHNWMECSEKLSASAGINNSPRISELATLLYTSVALSNLDEETRNSILNKWKGVVQMPMASR